MENNINNNQITADSLSAGAVANESNKGRMISVVACVLVQLCVGILYLWSVFASPVAELFKWTFVDGISATASMVSSLMIFGFVVGNLIGGILQDRFGPKWVMLAGCVLFSLGIFITSFLTTSSAYLIFVFYSGMSGIGCGFAYGSAISCLQKWFPKKRGFASGLSVASFGMSTVIFSQVARLLIKKVEVSKTFLILSLIFFFVSVTACLFIRLPKTIKAKKADLPGLTPWQAMRKPGFWCIALTCFFINATWNMLVPVIKKLGENSGLSPGVAVAVVTVTGITNACGRLIMASLSDKIGRVRCVIINAAVTAVSAIVLIWAIKGAWAGGAVYFALVTIVAFCYGGPPAIFPAMTTDLCGQKYGGTNYGIALLGLGFSSLFFNFISGQIVKHTGNYTLCFVIGAATCLIAAGFIFLYHYFNKKQKINESY